MLHVKALKILLCVIAILFIFNFIVQYLKVSLGSDYLFGFSNFFNLDREANLPAWFSSLILFISSLLLWIISSYKYIKFKKHWAFLSMVFLFLSLDEAALIHEKIGAITVNNINDDLSIYWHGVYTYIVFLILLGVPYTKFLMSLPVYYKKLFIFSGALFCMGALGLEFIGDLVAVEYETLIRDRNTYYYVLAYTVEEMMEMLGVSFFIYGLLKYMKDHNIPIAIKHE